ncbi:MAG: DUF6855 family protein [Streptosporangiaceae bacterium]
MAAGTKDDPWLLTTAPGTSQYSMYKDPQASPPALEELGLAELTHDARTNQVRSIN